MKVNTVAMLLACITLAGCAHQSVVDVAPAYNIASSYSQPIPGRWALYVDANDLEGKDLHMKGFECGAHRFPIAAGSAFAQSSLRTLKNVVQSIEMVDRPLSQASLKTQGFAGQILLKGEELDGDLVVITGFWSNKIEAEVDMAVSVRVEGQSGRLLGTTVSGDDESIHGAGAFCGGGAKAVADAGEGALKQIMINIAESISNAPRIREYASGEYVSVGVENAGNPRVQQAEANTAELLGLLQVERLARAQNCSRPVLLRNEMKVELYNVKCPDEELVVKCDWGDCSVLN